MFAWHPIEKRDAAGRLAAVGLEWTEGRDFLLTVWAAGVLGLAIVGGLVLAAGLISGAGWLLGSGAAMLVVGGVLYKAELPGQPRQLIFHRSGEITAPLGFSAYASRFRKVTGTIDDVESFGVRELKPRNGEGARFTHGVALYKKDGAVSYVASRLDPDEAHLVSVQMNRALDKLRDDMGGGNRKKAAAGARRFDVEGFIE